MNRKKRFLLLVVCWGLVWGYGCGRSEQHESFATPNTFTLKGSVREIHINLETPAFPDGDGKSGICILLQHVPYAEVHNHAAQLPPENMGRRSSQDDNQVQGADRLCDR